MDTKVRKIGNSLGVILPKGIDIEVNETFTVYKIDDKIILSPKKDNIYESTESWEDYAITEEDREWSNMKSEGMEE
ncbi:type II toxin-antitoxin system PemI/MazE family antitoxin [Alkalibacterium sp. MB6]|uniref:type II toxin-antitoxin system PemI/MazE family antitoxin n=1 Tax=Alkalibacterium sp. MB6 TaxID=2081965 RepID=UPI00137B2A31|nr:AbrB/MazE/SpoVT family DNA-binding domain-containing protein [Alkalibacterium sp. MB6]